MKRVLLLSCVFIFCLLSFLWYRWQPQVLIQATLTQAGIEVRSIEKSYWPALQLKELVWRDYHIESVEVSPAWRSLLRFSPALQVDMYAAGAQQTFNIAQSDERLHLMDVSLQMSLQEIKHYLPIAAMLPIEGTISAQIDELSMNLEDMMFSDGIVLLQTQNMQLKLGDQAEVLPNIQFEAVWKGDMWHWTIVSEVINGEGLIQQKTPFQHSSFSGKISIEKSKLPNTVQVFLPSQQEQVDMSLTGTLAAPAVKWL